jgi:predicted AAA+ superfamily ATPase
VRQAASQGDSTLINYWRTANGPEVDLVIEQAGGTVMAIECKWKELPDIADAAGLRALDEAEKGRIKEKFVVCRTKVSYQLSDGTWVVNLSELLKNLKMG